MTYWRYILRGLFLLALTAGSAGAQTDMPATGTTPTLIASASDNALNGTSWFFPAGYSNQYRSGDREQAVGDNNAICVEPDTRSFDATATTAQINREMEEALINDEALGRVSGGALLFTAPDAVRPRLFAIILWDEVKSKHSVSYEQGSGQIISTISVQQFK